MSRHWRRMCRLPTPEYRNPRPDSRVNPNPPRAVGQYGAPSDQMKNKASKAVKPLQPFLIGRYQLGWRMVNLYAMPDAIGGHFNLCRDKTDAEIHVGMDYSSSAYPFGVLCHEV